MPVKPITLCLLGEEGFKNLTKKKKKEKKKKKASKTWAEAQVRASRLSANPGHAAKLRK